MTSNRSFLSLLYYLGYPGAMVSWYGDETFQLFLLSHEMILDVAVVLMDKACQVAWLLKLLPAVGRNAIWQKQFNKRCMRNKKEPEHADPYIYGIVKIIDDKCPYIYGYYMNIRSMAYYGPVHLREYILMI